MYELNLKKMREEVDLTCKELSKILNVSSSVYNRWERNIITIPTKRLIELSNYYEVNIDYLLGLTNNKYHIKKTNFDINKISDNLKQIRKEHGESLRIFCKRLNTSNSTWHAYETGKTTILCSFLIQLCIESKYSADWILGRSNEKFINK